MAWTIGTVSDEELAARADDGTILLAHNVLADADSVRWTFDADADGEDETDPVALCQRLIDGSMQRASYPLGPAASVFYVHAAWLTSPVEFDALFAKLLGTDLFAYTSLVASIADDGDPTFSSPTTIATFSSPLGNARLLSTSLGTGDRRISGTGYLRLAFNYSSPSSPPLISELYVGRRRQMASGLDVGSYDDQPIGLDADDDVLRGGVRTRYVKASGFRDLAGSVTPGGWAYGIDETETWRQVASDCNFGRDPVVWIDRPLQGAAAAVFGKLVIPDGMRLPYSELKRRKGKVGIAEESPFVTDDTGNY